MDLLNQPPPPTWLTTRHCPKCSGTDLRTLSDEAEIGEWCSTFCADCGRLLRHDYIDGRKPWEDPEWAKASEQ